MTKQPEITERTRRNLLEAFWLLYRRNGIEGVTVREVAAKAGYNRGTFYEYFRDVHDCLVQIEAECIPGVDELPPIPDGPGVSPEFIESFIALYRERLERFDILLGERGDPSFRRRLIDSIKSSILARLAAGAPSAAGVLPAAEARELDYLLEFEISGLLGVLWRAFHARPRVRPEEIVRVVYRIMEGDAARRLRKRVAGRGARPRSNRERRP